MGHKKQKMGAFFIQQVAQRVIGPGVCRLRFHLPAFVVDFTQQRFVLDFEKLVTHFQTTSNNISNTMTDNYSTILLLKTCNLLKIETMLSTLFC